jgi:hypothetical protein
MSGQPLRRSDVNATLTPTGRRREVADALGISRQAAQQRFRKAGGARRPGGQRGSLR